MSAKMLCIVANQRSGTTAMRSALVRTGKFFDHGEIFHTSEADLRPGAFLRFCKDKDLKVADIATYENAKAAADAYFQYMRDEAGDRVSLVDVKFNSWLAFSPFWNYLNARPFFLEYLIQKGVYFVLLRRHDVAGQIASEWIARTFNRWHGVMDDEVSGSLTVDLKRARHQARQIISSERTLINRLTGVENKTTLFYEDLYIDGNIQSGPLADMFAHFGVGDTSLFESNIPRNTVNKAERIENFAQLVEEVKRRMTAAV